MRTPSATVWQTVGQVLWKLTVSSTRHDIASLAAVIAFYAFFSLFPLLSLMIYAASVLLPTESIGHLVSSMLQPYFPLLPQKSLPLFSIVHLSDIGAKVGLLSMITLAWSATSGFIAVQQAMDVIWETEEQRSYVGRRLIGFAMLVILLLITIGSAIAMAIYPVVHASVLNRAIIPLIQAVHVVSRVVFPVSLFFGFLVFYRYLPKRSAPWLYLLPGAFVAALLLDLGRAVFVWYASHLGSYEVVYGSLTAVMLLVIWMYIASILMLFGAEVSASLELVLENRRKSSV